MQLSLFYLIITLIPAGLSATKYFFEKNHHNQSTKQHLSNASRQQQQQKNGLYYPAPRHYEKEYFFFKAPEENHIQIETLDKLLNTIKKRQQVIFIKTPMNASYEKALKNLLQNSNEQQTHIYIFSQRPNFHGLVHKLQNIPKNILLKPEVHFVKYKSPADIQSVQSSIIQQFRAESDNYMPPPGADNVPVAKNYALNFLPSGIDVVPGSSYIPLFLF